MDGNRKGRSSRSKTEIEKFIKRRRGSEKETGKIRKLKRDCESKTC